MNRTQTIWTVLGVVVLIIIAFMLLNRPDAVENADEAAGTVATSTAQATAQAAARTEAAVELTALQARIAAGETYDSLATEFAEVRADLARAYENAEGETREEWQELERDFDSFEASARAGTSGFLDMLASLIGRLSADVRVESAGE